MSSRDLVSELGTRNLGNTSLAPRFPHSTRQPKHHKGHFKRSLAAPRTWATQASHPAFHILQDNLSAIKAISRDHLLLPELGQHTASHPSFHILQDNLSAIKGHFKTAPAAPGTQ
ncbi:hypothetical protein BDR07DRAFT_1379133 [Suillus spraguei]|nr:hypothetical protein BDR07DRAFT_1379133 [Suillus spraguei]